MALSLQLKSREQFESRTLRALGGGALAGALGLVVGSDPGGVGPGSLALWGAAVLASLHREWSPRSWGLWAVGLVVAIGLPSVLGLYGVPQAAAMGGLAAALVGWLGLPWKPRPAQVVAGAVGSAVLWPLGLYVDQVLQARLFTGQWSALGAVAGGAVAGLFWSMGTLLSHVQVHGDAVQAQGTALQARLAGEGQELVAQALRLYQQCREAARALGAGQAELMGALEKMAREAFALAESHAGLEGQLASVERGEVDGKVKALRERAATTEDAVARKQLELAASSLGEELNRLDTLQKRKERLVAQLHAQVALLERARVSLVGAQSAEAKDKGAQAAQLAQRLAALAQEGAGGQAGGDKPGPQETALAKAAGDSTKTAG